jgi:hypothetical protein
MNIDNLSTILSYPDETGVWPNCLLHIYCGIYSVASTAVQTTDEKKSDGKSQIDGCVMDPDVSLVLNNFLMHKS